MRYIVRSLAALVLLCAGFLVYRFNFEHTEFDTTKFADEVDMVLVEKGTRKLSLLSGQKVVAQYDIDLGFTPEGHKEREGDGKTPEGFYKISGRNPKSKYFLSLRISYPNEQDKLYAAEMGVSPGSDIMIHGLPNGLSFFGFKKKLKKDWTRGCIAVQTNAEMQEIWDNVRDGTMVEIRP